MTVTIYTKNGCTYCEEAKKYFQKLNIDVKEVNISEHPDKINELIMISGIRKVPVIVEHGKVTVGFNSQG